MDEYGFVLCPEDVTERHLQAQEQEEDHRLLAEQTAEKVKETPLARWLITVSRRRERRGKRREN